MNTGDQFLARNVQYIGIGLAALCLLAAVCVQLRQFNRSKATAKELWELFDMIAWLLAMMICVNDCPQYLPWVSAVYSFAGTALSIWFLIGSYHIMRDIFLRGGLIRLIIYLIVFARLAQQIAKALPEQAESMQFAVLFIGAIIGLLFARLQTVLGNESPTLEPEDGPEIAHAR